MRNRENMKIPKVIIDSEHEHIVRYWHPVLKQVMFEVIINAEYTIHQLEFLIKIFNREIINARKERASALEIK